MDNDTKKVVNNITLTISNCLSGRFILTIVGCLAFYKLAVTACCLLLAKIDALTISDAMMLITNLLLILSNIFTFYFVKSNLQPPNKVNPKNENEN